MPIQRKTSPRAPAQHRRGVNELRAAKPFALWVTQALSGRPKDKLSDAQTLRAARGRLFKNG